MVIYDVIVVIMAGKISLLLYRCILNSGNKEINADCSCHVLTVFVLQWHNQDFITGEGEINLSFVLTFFSYPYAITYI